MNIRPLMVGGLSCSDNGEIWPVPRGRV